MTPGYHTSGLLLHDVCVVVNELAHLGYSCVAVRPHAGSFNPSAAEFGQQVLRLADAVSRAQMRLVLDIDAPYLHDPLKEHGPSLVSSDEDEAKSASAWIETWTKLAEELGAGLITFSSGNAARTGSDPDEEILERLANQLNHLMDRGEDDNVQLALRPRSGDVIATVAHFERLGQWLHEPSRLRLAADIGEMLVGGELPVVDRLVRNREALACVYLCDRRAGHVGDLRIGHGHVALTRILRSLREIEFGGPVIFRVDGHSELGFTPAREAIEIYDDDDV